MEHVLKHALGYVLGTCYGMHSIALFKIPYRMHSSFLIECVLVYMIEYSLRYLIEHIRKQMFSLGVL